MGETKPGGLGKSLLVVLACLFAALLIPVGAISSIICVLGDKEADYNAKVAKALFANGPWPPSLSLETDLYYVKMRIELEELTSAWIGLHSGDSQWKVDDHDEESLLMRVCFYARFYKSSRTFKDDDYKAFTKLFDKAATVNEVFEELDFFYGNFGDEVQKAVRDCVFVVTIGTVPPLESNMSPDFGKWKQHADQDWRNLPGNIYGPDVVWSLRTRLGDPYSDKKRGVGKYVDCSWLAKWCWASV